MMIEIRQAYFSLIYMTYIYQYNSKKKQKKHAMYINQIKIYSSLKIFESLSHVN